METCDRRAQISLTYPFVSFVDEGMSEIRGGAGERCAFFYFGFREPDSSSIELIDSRRQVRSRLWYNVCYTVDFC